MRATTTLGNLIEQVETMSAGNFDETVSLNEIEFSSLNEMWIGGVGVEVLPQAQRLLANRLGVPFSYLDRCPTELQAENLNYWLEQERKERNTFFCRFNGQRQVRAVFTDRYTAIDNREILSKMLELRFGPEQEAIFRIDDSMMVVKIPDTGRSFEVALKDTMVPGLSIGNSEIGFLSFCIECFYLGWSAPTAWSCRSRPARAGSSTSAGKPSRHCRKPSARWRRVPTASRRKWSSPSTRRSTTRSRPSRASTSGSV